jgi:hypothetical protein
MQKAKQFAKGVFPDAQAGLRSHNSPPQQNALF